MIVLLPLQVFPDYIDQSYDTALTAILPQEITKGLPQATQFALQHLLDQIPGFPNYEMEHQANRKVLIEDLYKAYQLFSLLQEPVQMTKSASLERDGCSCALRRLRFRLLLQSLG